MTTTRAPFRVITAALLLALGAPDFAARAETVTVEASTRYERNRLHQFTFGGGYRELWKAPVELPVLDLKTVGGGLTPTKRFGGNQTPVLGFKGRDGRSYS